MSTQTKRNLAYAPSFTFIFVRSYNLQLFTEGKKKSIRISVREEQWSLKVVECGMIKSMNNSIKWKLFSIEVLKNEQYH